MKVHAVYQASPVLPKDLYQVQETWKFSFSHTLTKFSLFWPKKVHFKAKINLFPTFVLLNFLGRTLHFVETLILYFLPTQDIIS